MCAVEFSSYENAIFLSETAKVETNLLQVQVNNIFTKIFSLEMLYCYFALNGDESGKWEKSISV